MNRFWRQIRIVFLLFSILSLIIATGCVKRPGIPVEEIREKADRAFDDLKAEETGQTGTDFPKERRKEETGQSDRFDKGQKGSAHVITGKRPDWVNGESVLYPSSLYLTGVGYDSERQSAEDKARAEIAKIFYSNIDSRTRTYQGYLQTTSRGETRTKETFDIKDITRVSTQKVLSGVKISQVYRETEPESLFYALAVLDRRQSAEILRHKIQELDQDIQRLFTGAQEKGDKLTRVKNLKEAIRKHILREACNTELRIVNISGEGIPPKTDFTEMKNCLSAVLLRDFLIALSVEGSRADEIQEALIQGLNREGFSVCEDVGRATVLVRGTVEIKPIDRGTPEWKYVRWKTHFDLLDRRGGAVFGSIGKTGREGHVNLLQAEDRAVRKMQNILTTDIVRDITKYICK
jgi:hypothetical protein